MAALPSNALFAYPNFVDPSAVYTPTFSGGKWQAGAPLINLQNPRLAYKTRSVDLVPDSTQFVVDLGTLRTVKVIAIPRHNLSLSATYAISFYTDAALTNQVAMISGPVFAIIYPWGSLPFENPAWYNGKFTAEQWVTIKSPLLVVLSASTLARYIRFAFVDTANVSGYVELSRLVVAPGWQPTSNIDYSAQIGVNDPTVVTPSLASVDYFDQRQKRRTAVVHIPYLNQNEAFSQVLDLQSSAGVSGQLFFSFDPTDTANLFRHSFLATLTKLDPLTAASYGYQAASFSLQEVVG